jgi:DNA-directed RNA polymerase specialized sigma24 family protein
MGMRTTTNSVTAESFEKVFVGSATNRNESHATKNLDWTDWRDIARKALRNKELGDALRNAVVPLPAKYREVLFLRDVKNLDTDETAWILGIAGGAVKAWLSRARILVREALTSALSPRLTSKCSNLAGFYCDLQDSGSELVAILR